MTQVSIAIIEDDPNTLSATAEFLASCGYNVSNTCNSVPSFFESLSLSPPPDVILLDIMIDNHNSLSQLSKINLLAPRSKIIITTAYLEPTYLFQSLEAGVCGYYDKGTGTNNLIVAIQACLSDQAYLSPAATKMLINQMRDSFKNYEEESIFKGIATQFGLNKRESGVLIGLFNENSYQEIADKNHVSINTIRHYVMSLYKKLGIHKRETLIQKIRDISPSLTNAIKQNKNTQK